MDLFHYHIASGNFGDDLNTWLWDAVLPGWREMLPGHLLVGVGTLINDKLPRGVPKVVLGSGVGYGGLPDAALMAECRFVAVRGPRSAKALGLPPETGIVDPAVLIADLPEFQNIPKSGRPVFVPHHASVHRVDWARLCDKAGVDYVSPEGEARDVIRKLAAAPLVIAESMHAVILADAFGTPWHAVSISYRFNSSKWVDWAESLGINLTIRPLFPLLDAAASILPKRNSLNALDQSVNNQSISNAVKISRKLPLRSRVRLTLEEFYGSFRLREISRNVGQLSNRGCLSDAKSRYRAVLDELSRGT